MKTFLVYELFGEFAISDKDGELLYSKIENELKEGKSVTVDFSNVETVLTQFLNSAIATLYKDYTSEYLKENLKVTGLKSMDSLRKVVSRAKMFYKDEQSAKIIMEEE